MKFNSLSAVWFASIALISASYAAELYEGAGYTIEKPEGIGEVEIQEFEGFTLITVEKKGVGFASINLTVSPLPTSLESYLEILKKPFEKMNGKASVEERIDENTIYLLYDGKVKHEVNEGIEGMDSVFSLLIVVRDGTLYQVTGSTSYELKDTHLPALEKAVKSFALKE